MPPQIASLLHFPGRVIRQLFPPAAVAAGLVSLPSARCQLNSTRPFTFPASLSALAIAIVSGLLCSPGFAAVRITSLGVSATVVSGCQVSPAAAERSASAPGSWSASVNVICSLPVAYQVSVSSNSEMANGTELAALGSTSSLVAGLPGYARTRDLDSLRPLDHSVQATGEPAYSLIGPSSGSPASPESADRGADRPVDAPTPRTMTVTIVY
jgi:hypothetical protein